MLRRIRKRQGSVKNRRSKKRELNINDFLVNKYDGYDIQCDDLLCRRGEGVPKGELNLVGHTHTNITLVISITMMSVHRNQKGTDQKPKHRVTADLY